MLKCVGLLRNSKYSCFDASPHDKAQHSHEALIGIVQLVWLYCLADHNGDGTRNPETQKPRDPETQKPKDPETQRPRDPKTQRPRNPKTQRPRDPKTWKPRQPQEPKGPRTKNHNDLSAFNGCVISVVDIPRKSQKRDYL